MLLLFRLIDPMLTMISPDPSTEKIQMGVNCDEEQLVDPL